MRGLPTVSKLALVLGAATVLVAIAAPAQALDAYQDRRGMFYGMGLGGGGAFQDGDPGGALLLDFQLGGGATQNLTLDLDLDFWFQLMEDNRNLLITPGPELNYFFGDTGIFVRAGVGMALTFVWYDKASLPTPSGGKDPEDTEFKIGFDSSLGFGWEFWGTSNLAFGIAVEGDYVVLKNDDLATIGFVLSLKHY